MLIKALCDYYDMQDKKQDNGDKIPAYLSEQAVHYMIYLTKDGDISHITDIRVPNEDDIKNGKKKPRPMPKIYRFPKRSQKTSIALNIIEHRPTYIFGLNYDKGTLTTEDKTNKAKKSHEMFKDGNMEFFKDLHSDICVAFYNFLEKWQPENETENEILLGLGTDISSCSFCFALDGHPEIMLQNDKEVIEKYAAQQSENSADDNDNKNLSACAITGEKLPVARIHDKIKGMGNATGNVLVGIKNTAFESYGKTQSYNSNISEVAMKKYTSALNSLLADRRHRIMINDVTVLFFAISDKDEQECSIFELMTSSMMSEDVDTNGELLAALKAVKSGGAYDISSLGANADDTFYVVGLTPNVSRISQKFIMRDKFGNIMNNMFLHQKDMAVNDSGRNIYINMITRELISPKSTNDNVPPSLISALFYSILNGTDYPDNLLYTVIKRVQTDKNTQTDHYIKLNDVRLGLIKACLNRKARNNHIKEEITMSLNEENLSQAYLCGRLFAVLEKMQKDALGNNINTTIVDSFFTSACSTPAVVFPRLIQLSMNHQKTLRTNNPQYYISLTKTYNQIIDGIEDKFPQTLSIEQQGEFILGYGQQNNSFYSSTKTKSENN